MARRIGPGRACHLVLIGLAPAVLGGCYQYAYAPATPAPGSYAIVHLNDRGRVALEQNVGPSVATVEGLVASSDDSTLVLQAQRTTTLSGAATRWSGEQVAVRREYIGLLRERTYSAGRTVVLVGSLAIGVGAFIASTGLFGFGSGDSGSQGQPPPPSGQ